VYFHGNLFPGYPLSLQPSFRFNYHSDATGGIIRNAEKMETAVGLIYKPLESPYRISVKTAYVNGLTLASNEEWDEINFAAKIDWKPEQGKQDSSSDWSIDYQLKDVRDLVNPNARSSDWSISLIWRMPIG
jgi:hypothetical protein